MNDKYSYSAIDTPSYDEIINFLVHDQPEITFKIGSEHFKSKIHKMNGDRPLLYKFKLTPFQNQEVHCSFDVGTDKYFFKSKINTELNDLVLIWPSEIFKLQGENNFRFAVPEDMNYVCEITHINGFPKKISCQIRDMSLGGIKLICPVVGRKDYSESEMTLKIIIKDYELYDVPCQVKLYVPPKGSSRTQISLKFLDNSASFLTDLHNLLIYLDRVQRGKILD